MPELTLGNHYQQFLDNWYSKLKRLYLSLMEDIVQFCDKTIIKKTKEITTTKQSLKASTNDNRLQEIKAELMKIKESSKKIYSKNSIHRNTKPLFSVILTVKKMMQHKIEQEN